MRFCRKFVIAAFAMAAAGVAMSQQPGQPKGGFGKGKGGQDINYMTLFQNPQVRAELKISDEQLAKLLQRQRASLVDHQEGVGLRTCQPERTHRVVGEAFEFARERLDREGQLEQLSLGHSGTLRELGRPQAASASICD